MSYINFTLTHRLADPAHTVRRLDVGFGREGGKLEFARTSVSSTGILPPLRRELPLDDAHVAAASSLLGAIQAAGWVQDVDVADTLVREPATVTWTTRHGQGGTGFDGQLPTAVQAVVDAARALDQLPVA